MTSSLAFSRDFKASKSACETRMMLPSGYPMSSTWLVSFCIVAGVLSAFRSRRIDRRDNFADSVDDHRLTDFNTAFGKRGEPVDCSVWNSDRISPAVDHDE